MSNHELPENEDDSQVKLAESGEASSRENPDTGPGTPREGGIESTDLGYAVGYGRPPAHTRFRPGRSGNPRGRPRGSKNMKTILNGEIARNITITENGRPKKVSVAKAALMKLIARALSGDDRALEKLLDMAFKYGADDSDRISTTGKSDEEKFLDLMKLLLRDREGNQQ